MALDVTHDLGLRVAGFVDDGAVVPSACGVEVVGGVAWLLAQAAMGHPVAAFVAVGDNNKRADLFSRLTSAGVTMPNLVHPRAYVAPSAILGHGNLVMAHSYIGTRVTLGNANLLFAGSCLHHDNVVGDGNFFAPGVTVGGRTAIPNLCKFGMNCTVHADVTLPDAFSCALSAIVGAQP